MDATKKTKISTPAQPAPKQARAPEADATGEGAPASEQPAQEGESASEEPVAEPVARPTLDELYAARYEGKSVELVYLDPPARARIAGVHVTHEPKVYEIDRIAKLGASYMLALAVDPSISVRIVD